MRRWAILVLVSWVGVIAAYVHAAAVGMPAPTPASAMAGMDCDCPSEKPDCKDTSKPDKGCLSDPGCLARCSFVQPAMAGPTIAYRAAFTTLELSVSQAPALPGQRGSPPERPPKLQIHV